MLRRLIAYFRTDAESSSVLDRPKGRRGWRIRMEPIPMARTQ